MISYIKLPHIPGRVASSRLRKSIYGPKQASRVWAKKLLQVSLQRNG
jgi:hypothetical protein